MHIVKFLILLDPDPLLFVRYISGSSSDPDPDPSFNKQYNLEKS
jgi:hypothetical protein